MAGDHNPSKKKDMANNSNQTNQTNQTNQPTNQPPPPPWEPPAYVTDDGNTWYFNYRRNQWYHYDYVKTKYVFLSEDGKFSSVFSPNPPAQPSNTATPAPSNGQGTSASVGSTGTSQQPRNQPRNQTHNQTRNQANQPTPAPTWELPPHIRNDGHIWHFNHRRNKWYYHDLENDRWVFLASDGEYTARPCNEKPAQPSTTPTSTPAQSNSQGATAGNAHPFESTNRRSNMLRDRLSDRLISNRLSDRLSNRLSNRANSKRRRRVTSTPAPAPPQPQTALVASETRSSNTVPDQPEQMAAAFRARFNIPNQQTAAPTLAEQGTTRSVFAPPPPGQAQMPLYGRDPAPRPMPTAPARPQPSTASRPSNTPQASATVPKPAVLPPLVQDTTAWPTMPPGTSPTMAQAASMGPIPGQNQPARPPNRGPLDRGQSVGQGNQSQSQNNNYNHNHNRSTAATAATTAEARAQADTQAAASAPPPAPAPPPISRAEADAAL
ncbi:unnamed protein product [Zymoseptoria tritici ST99CH_1A5]|uniref:Uncharacterized protein n=1 Tax=Zymoseptoria tritici ST99CH_1A5 TaxID=1276529 RepID=A0A1Y6LVQ8_ZYMTR|nr:unnamed protein product [Zymoseptoria tritici ST99CH_1A5]